MSDAEPDNKSQYAEGCNALRHYSLCVLNTRILTIGQGFVLLSAAAYFIKERIFLLSIFVSVFSLLFTLVLHDLQNNYWLHFESILKRVVELERSLAGDKSNPESPDGPWGVYQKQRTARHEKRRWKYFAVNGPFNLLLIASLAMPGFAISNFSPSFAMFNLSPAGGFVVYLILASVIFFFLIKLFQMKDSKEEDSKKKEPEPQGEKKAAT